MTSGERYYLLLIIVAFVGFAGVLAYQAWRQNRSDAQPDTSSGGRMEE